MFDLNMTIRAADITSRAMLAQLTISQWSARKLDKRASAEILSSNSAKIDSGRFNKSLVAKEALAAIQTVASKARQDHLEMSLPWLQDGTRILPVDAFNRYTAAMQKHRQDFESAVDMFCREYPDYIEQARRDLGGLFNESEYPDLQFIRKRFAWNVAILPLPKADDFRVDLDSATVALIQNEMQQNIQTAINGAMRDVSERLYSVVKTMADKLAGYDPQGGKQGGVFRDSLVQNVRDLVDIIPTLNLTNDPRLNDLVTIAKEKLTIHDASVLRDDSTIRNETAKAAADIADALAGFM